MKKHLIQAVLISLFVNLCLFTFNPITVNNTGNLPLGKTYPGGDCVERIGFGVNGFGCGSLADVVTFDRELRKVVKRLRKAGDGSLQIHLARYGRDRNRNLEQMSFDSWETSGGDITEEDVYLRPDTRYTNEVRDRVLVEGSLEEMGI